MKPLLWAGICVVLAGMAVAAPVIIVRERPQGAATTPQGTVLMQRLAYAPGSVTVPAGTEVLFDNRDVAPHTVTSDDGSIESGVIDPGRAFRLVVQASLDYHCAIHPSMKGKVVLAA